jgi:hypothetical protein
MTLRSVLTFVGLVLLLGAAGMPPDASAQPATRPGQKPAAAPPAATVAKPGHLTVRSWPSQTALWVGDRVLFTVEIDCAPTADILSDDLAREKLRLEGLEVLDSNVERRPAESGEVHYRFVYRLTTYDTGTTPRKIEPMIVRYGTRRAGGRVEDTVAAGEIKIPGATLSLRSTIPDELTDLAPRDNRALDAVPWPARFANPVGIGLIALSAAPVAILAGSWLKRAGQRVKRKDTRAVRRQSRAALEDLGPVDATNDEARRDAFARLNKLVRQHLAESAGLPAQALTAAEITERLTAKSSTMPVESVSMVLGECERALYAPPSLLPNAERFRESVTAAEQVVTSRRSRFHFSGPPYSGCCRWLWWRWRRGVSGAASDMWPSAPWAGWSCSVIGLPWHGGCPPCSSCWGSSRS